MRERKPNDPRRQNRIKFLMNQFKPGSRLVLSRGKKADKELISQQLESQYKSHLQASKDKSNEVKKTIMAGLAVRQFIKNKPGLRNLSNRAKIEDKLIDSVLAFNLSKYSAIIKDISSMLGVEEEIVHKWSVEARHLYYLMM